MSTTDRPRLDPPGTCHLVMCPGKGIHPPHAGPMAAPTPESLWAQEQAALKRTAEERNAACVCDHARRLKRLRDWLNSKRFNGQPITADQVARLLDAG